ncbi:MAG: hydroxyacylglutathione hydrolase [Steroidobacteraceae bacterium]
MHTVSPVKAFSDNYIWLLEAKDAPRALVVDPGDAQPVLEVLKERELELVAILVTHHHADHVGGVQRLVEVTGARVFGPAGEALPIECERLSGGQRLQLDALGLTFEVLDVPGHTSGHIAYHSPGMLFCGDTLFSGGCGRLFEGTAAQMLASLDALAALPPDTRVYCAHEYTLSNLRFALAVDPANARLVEWNQEAEALRQRDLPTLPTTLELELKVNPFLRVRSPAVRQAAESHVGHGLQTATEVFAAVRAWKDGFR